MIFRWLMWVINKIHNSIIVNVPTISVRDFRVGALFALIVRDHRGFETKKCLFVLDIYEAHFSLGLSFQFLPFYLMTSICVTMARLHHLDHLDSWLNLNVVIFLLCFWLWVVTKLPSGHYSKRKAASPLFSKFPL